MFVSARERKLPINKIHASIASVQISCRYENRARAEPRAGFTARVIFSSLGALVRSLSISRLSLPFRSPSLDTRTDNPPLVSPERRAHPRKCASHSTWDFSPTGLLQAQCPAQVITRKSVANRVIADAIILLLIKISY